MRNFSQFIEATVTSDADRLTDEQKKNKEDREARKPSQDTQSANQANQDMQLKIEKEKRRKEQLKQRNRTLGLRDQQRKLEMTGREVAKSQEKAAEVRGGPVKREVSTSKDGSVSATGKVGRNLAKVLVQLLELLQQHLLHFVREVRKRSLVE